MRYIGLDGNGLLGGDVCPLGMGKDKRYAASLPADVMWLCRVSECGHQICDVISPRNHPHTHSHHGCDKKR